MTECTPTAQRAHRKHQKLGWQNMQQPSKHGAPAHKKQTYNKTRGRQIKHVSLEHCQNPMDHKWLSALPQPKGLTENTKS